MKTMISLVMLSLLVGTPVFAEGGPGKSDPNTTQAVPSTTSTATQTTATPPGLKKQGKTPPGLKKKGKTPPGWSHGRKTGLGNNPSHASHPVPAAHPGVGQGHR